MVDRKAALPIVRQCQLLDAPRSTFYCRGQTASAEEAALMKLIDECHLQPPPIRGWLEDRGEQCNRKRIQRLMRAMGLAALYPKRSLNRANQAHRGHPYRLKGLRIDRPNQVSAADVTYVPMAWGFLYLLAVIDRYLYKVLAWRLSNTMDTEFCVETLEGTLGRYGTPEIFTTDQGSQFTSEAFTSVLRVHEIQISMDGKGRWVNNVFVECLWRSLKYEEVYLRAYDSVAEARRSIDRCMAFFNSERRHQPLRRKTADTVYFKTVDQRMAA